MAVVAGVVIAANPSARILALALDVGYAATLFSVGALLWSFLNFLRIDGFRDKLAAAEVEKKEKTRLLAELTSGSAHDFNKDEELKGYVKPATPLQS